MAINRFIRLVKYISLLSLIIVLHSVNVHAQLTVFKPSQSGFSFEKLFKLRGQTMDSVLIHKEDYRLQILYTIVERDAQNKAHLTTYNLDADKYYYYCASMVKLPATVLALEKLNALADHHATMLDSFAIDSIHCSGLNAESMLLGTGFSCIGEYIKEMLVLSNNMAFNPLYDFIGQQYFQDRLHEIGCKSAIISHRFAGCDSIENRYCNAIDLYDRNSHLLKYIQPRTINTRRQFYDGLLSTQVGNGYMANGKLVNEPKDFRYNNYIALSDLHQLLIKIMLPETQKPEERLRLSPSDYQYLYKCMGMYPRECAYPVLDSLEYPDNYMKYFVGLPANTFTMPTGIRVFNKVGQAYGFMTDCSYVVDTLHKVEFFLSCSMYLNSDGVLNDSKYDYDSIGYPFFHQLYSAIYAEEAVYGKAFLPQLSLPDFSDTLIAPIPAPEVWLYIDSTSPLSKMETVLSRRMARMNTNPKPTDDGIFHKNLAVVLRQSVSTGYPFDILKQKGLSIIAAPDNRLRLFDWNIDSSALTHAIVQWQDSNSKIVVSTTMPVEQGLVIPKLHFTTIDQIDTRSGRVYMLMGVAMNGTVNTNYIQAYQIVQQRIVPAKVFEINHEMTSSLEEENLKGTVQLKYNAKRKLIQMTGIVIKHGKARRKNLKLKFDGGCLNEFENLKMEQP